MTSSTKKYSKKKIVVCLSRFPYPIEKGDKLRAYYQIISLAESFDVYLVCTSNKTVAESDIQQLEPYCKEIHIFKLKPLLIYWRLLMTIFSNLPFQVSYFTQRHIQRKINTLLNRLNPDHLYCQLIRPAEYVKNYHNCPKTIDLMDALSKGIERRIKKAPFFLKFILREENRRLIFYERKIIDYFELATIISQQDKNFILHPKKESILVIPNGVNTDYFCPAPIQEQAQFDIVFVGNMNYPPNVEAAKLIAQDILPQLQLKRPALNFLISGANPSRSVLNLASEHVHISGWVDDIRTSYHAAKIFVAPMFTGTGMQNKLLEAMALGLPCVTSTLANNAILAEAEKDILLGDNVAAICVQIERLLDEPHLYHQLVQNGRHFVQEKYRWPAINQKLIKSMKTKNDSHPEQSLS